MSADLENIKVNLEKAEKAVEDEIEKVVRQWAEAVKTSADTTIRAGNAIATMQMLRNIRSNVTREVGKITGVVGVGSNVPYAIFRHENTKPHFPPIEPLTQWVIKKGLIKSKSGKSRTAASFKKGRNADSLTAEARGIAFLIARKIARQGTTGLPFLKIAMNLNRERLFASLAKIQV